MSEVTFFRSDKGLRIEFKLANDKFSTKVREVTPEDIETYAAEYQLFEATEGGTVALETTLAKLITENKALKAELAALKAPLEPNGELLVEAELEIEEEEKPRKGRK